jgi:hypothetical protein
LETCAQRAAAAARIKTAVGFKGGGGELRIVRSFVGKALTMLGRPTPKTDRLFQK